MKRPGLPPRTSYIARSRVKPKRRTAAEQREKFAREYHSEERVLCIQSLPSVATGLRPCVNSHVRTEGMSRKAGYAWIVPLTLSEEKELHRIGVRSFAVKYDVDLQAEAEQTAAAWNRRES